MPDFADRSLADAAVLAPPPVRNLFPLPRYDRARDLPRLVPLWPSEIVDGSAAGLARLVQRLRRALREERRRGIAGHWAYDLARHAALLRAYNRELEALRRASLAIVGTVSPVRPPGMGGPQPPVRAVRLTPCRRA